MASLENFRLVVFRAVAEQFSFRKAAFNSLIVPVLHHAKSGRQVLLNYCEQVKLSSPRPSMRLQR
jgi:hypothetical protein